ncbi:MAG: M23 family metallopeptidase [Arcobacteraceae bacterium]
MKKNIFLTFCLIFLSSYLLANDEVKLYFHKDTISNAHTALLFLEAQNIKNPKLSLEELHIDFLPDIKKENRYFALIPISYYAKPKKYKVIVSYETKEKKEFKGITLNVTDGNYKSEVLSVQPSKIHLNDVDKKRSEKEYKEAMLVYNEYSKNLETSFIKPLETPITSNFGNKRIYNDSLQSFHSGTDFRAPIGTPLYASAKGTVKIAKNRFYAGNSVIIDHGYGVFSCYFHLDKISVKEGQTVSQKEFLGYSGNTGRVTGPHLHFTIRVKNTLVDPLQFIEVMNILN